MDAQPPTKRFFVVLGMHRAGTSLVTRIANLAGLDLGPDESLLPPAEDNPMGFWEAEGIKRVNDSVLAALGGTWHHPPPRLEAGWETSRAFDALRGRAKGVLEELFGESEGPAGWKDPRTSLVLPFWRSVVPIEGTILLLRDPREVAVSLLARNGFSPEVSAELWLRYTADAWRDGEPAVLCRYRDVLEDPVAHAEAIAQLLGTAPLSEEAHEAVSATARKDLHRSVASDTTADGPMMRIAATVHRLAVEDPTVALDILGVVSERWELAGGIRRALRQLDEPNGESAPPLLLSATLSELDTLAADVERSEIERRDAETRAADSERRLHQAEQQVEALRESRDRANERVEALREESAVARSDARQRIENLRTEAETRAAYSSGRMKRLEAELELSRRQARSDADRIRALTRDLAMAEKDIQKARREYDRLSNRRVVRAGLAAATAARPVVRAVRTARKRSSAPSQKKPNEPSEGAPAPRAGTGTKSAGHGDAPAPDLPYARLVDRLSEAPPVTVVIPIYNAPGEVREAAESVLRHSPTATRLLLIDDASPDPAIAPLLSELADHPRVQTLTNEQNLGFVATVNRGFENSEGDVVVLNSDTIVTPGWLTHLRTSAYLDETTGTVTPLSDNAGAFAVPEPGKPNPTPAGLTRDDIARLVTRASGHLRPKTPTAHGFCMYVKRAMLDEVGLFDVDTFGRGYGEENDLSLRAGRLGWKHVVEDSTLVFHVQGASFGGERDERIAQARTIIDERYPEYTDAVRAFMRGSEMAEVRTRVGDAFQNPEPVRPRALFVIHDGTGGTPHTNRDLMKAIEDGWDPLLLTSDRRNLKLRAFGPDGIVEIAAERLPKPLGVQDIHDDHYVETVARWIVEHSIELVHVRQMFKHTLDMPRVARSLGVPVILSFHDFYYSCPTVHLLDHRDDYCGGVCTPGDGVCVAPNAGREVPHLKHAWVHTWRDHVRAAFDHVDAFVTTTESAKEIVLGTYPELGDRSFSVIEHGRDLPQLEGINEAPTPDRPIRIVVLGSLGVHKGARFVQAVKNLDVNARIEFHFLGSVPEEYQHLGVVHGPYERGDFANRLRDIRPHLVGLFSIWPETYCHTLTEGWSAGIPAVVSSLGALGERVDRHGGGWTVDVDDPAGAYATIIGIAESPEEYAAQAASARVTDLPTTADMGARYEELYERTVLHDLAAEPHSHTSLDMFLVGELGRHPASAYVRSLQRFRHPSAADRLVARVREHGSVRPGAPAPDIAWVQRTALLGDSSERLLAWADANDVRIVFDLDDNLLDDDPGLPSEYRNAVQDVRRLTGRADLVTVSTEPLREIAEAHNDNVMLLPNHLDDRLWFDEDGDARPAGFDGTRIRLLYMGTKTHAQDLAILREPLEVLRSRLGIAVDLTVIGGEEARSGEWYQRLNPPRGHTAYPRFVRWLRSLASEHHIAVAPLVENRFNRYKSDLKHLEYAALGLPGAFSRVGPYADSVEHARTGILTENDPEAWVTALQGLVDDYATAVQMAETARAHVAGTRTLAVNASEIDTLLSRVGISAQ